MKFASILTFLPMLTLTHDGRNRIAISHLTDFFLVSQMTNGNSQLKSCGRSNTIPEYIFFFYIKLASTGNKCVGYMRQTSNQKIKNEKKN